ncbi:MAG: 1,4-alpha-glucan branching protein GlgB [Acidobacteriota bacterium]
MDTLLHHSAALARGEHGNPFAVLGPQRTPEGPVVRAFIPEARSVELLRAGKNRRPLRLDPIAEGLFETPVPDGLERTYRLRVESAGGHRWEQHDPYAFRDLWTDLDWYLLGEGTHYNSYEKLGAHPLEIDGVRGTMFAVWAPNAARVSIVGDFNHWDGRRYPMDQHHSTGIWQLFLPDIGHGTVYKYEIRARLHALVELRSDPYGSWFEVPPQNASRVYDGGAYPWGDQEWLDRRAASEPLNRPLNTYEVHLGSWRRLPEEKNRMLTYRELADQLLPYVQQLGYTHIQLMPVTEYPFSGSWGYQCTGYFAPTSRHGEPNDFRYFVDRCHRSGIGVLLDFVPAHFPRDHHALARFDGTALYEHEDPRRGEHPDWGTLIFNFGRTEVANFLLSSALFWIDQFHIDGLRVDAVASMLYLDYSKKEGEWIPNSHGGRENIEAVAFLKRFNELIHEKYPGALTIAEESTAWPAVSRPTYLGGLGFSMKWNMGWMNDMLRYMALDPVHRKYHHNHLTFSLMYAFSENFILPLSHDEVVHGKRSLLEKLPGDVWQKFANLRCFYGFMMGHPGKKLLFMGGEFGQWREWNYDDSLDWHLLEWNPHFQLQSFVRDANQLYLREPALWQIDFAWQGFEWIDFHDWANSIVAFLRRGKDPRDFLVIVCNFTPVPRFGYRVGVPEHTFYTEVLNSDAACYGGSNLGNVGGLHSDPLPWNDRLYSLNLTLPPLSTLVLKPRRSDL